MVLSSRRVLTKEHIEIALAKHADAAWDEILYLTDEPSRRCANPRPDTAILELYPTSSSIIRSFLMAAPGSRLTGVGYGRHWQRSSRACFALRALSRRRKA